ncbi:hypothetical protein FB45DRAFT_1025347 [Roridomyces roridus]|uniref:Nephrocystin 3-like N-terminal domain-containing protein n=1 Tax=Roridomyces roridus TaxID=1738132 RepID=A0AAD7BYK8_9AGAR|nr:hypothetical protein FB45DRAFT_1025347 [Roridomyces roridus]
MPPLIEGDNPVHFENSTFNSVAGNMNIFHATNVGDGGLDILSRAVSVDAIHNSAVRPDDPACHPGTRDEILKTIDGPLSSPQIARYSGFTAALASGDLPLLNSSRPAATLEDNWAAPFSSEAMRTVEAGENFQTDRLVLNKSMGLQLEALIVEPFTKAAAMSSRPVLVVDGLDECDDHAVQIKLVKAFISFIRAGRPPVHILICSRSEPHIREIILAANNSDICRDHAIRPDATAYADVRRFLTHGFARLGTVYAARGIALENNWPGYEVMNQLVDRASGTFIYASTVLRYIDDEYSHPVDRLNAVLRLDPSSTTPLDDLRLPIPAALFTSSSGPG